MTDLEHTHIRVRTKKGVESFRRAGRAFGFDAVIIAIAVLSAEELKAIEDEPKLNVERFTPDEDELGEGEGDEGGADDDGDGESADASKAKPPTKATKGGKPKPPTKGTKGSPKPSTDGAA